MRRAACLIIAAVMAVAVNAQGVQDFASRFVQECDVDTAVQCITVSPKMMEQLTKKAGTDNKASSARIVTTSTRCETYYRKAENLLKKNAQRFRHNRDYRNSHGHGTFYTRKTRSGDTVELVMLHADTDSDTLVIVNLTGDIDEEFIANITRTFGNRKGNID